jgi:ferredoxin
MAITRVWLDESENECTMCGACEAICDAVFEVPEKMIVKKNADLSLEDEILESAEGCPVATIAIEYDNSGKRDNPA